MRACMEVLANTFRAYSRGEAVQPLRTMMKVPGGGGILAPMPGYDGASKALAVKLITVFHNESETKFDSHQGLVVLFSAKHGNFITKFFFQRRKTNLWLYILCLLYSLFVSLYWRGISGFQRIVDRSPSTGLVSGRIEKSATWFDRWAISGNRIGRIYVRLWRSL